MHREILGSVLARKKHFLTEDTVYRFCFTRDSIIAVASGSAPVGDTGMINRVDILSAGKENFEIPYIQIREVVTEKSGFTFPGIGRTGKITLDTYDGKREFDIMKGQDYEECLAVINAVLGDKLINKTRARPESLKPRKPAEPVKYCPKCGAEYQEWVTNCLDCGVKLVSEPPEFEEEDEEPVFSNAQELRKIPGVSGKPGDTMVSIARAPNELVAQMWKGLLDEQEIPSMVKRTVSSGYVAHYQQASSLGTHEILVLVPDAKRAWEILEPFLDV
ncbi:MAG: DUF2007 domain-containing protein [Dehalococcoidales bacterium]|nr:DUF2007 domain-containing protein [Dehalococcoidales bacterium]